MNGEQQIRSQAALAAATLLSGMGSPPEDFLYVTEIFCAYIRDGSMGEVRTAPAGTEQAPEVETHALPDTVVTSAQSNAVRNIASMNKARADMLKARVKAAKTPGYQGKVRIEIQDSGLDDVDILDDDGSMTTLGAYADKIFGS